MGANVINRVFGRAMLRLWALNIGLCALLLAGCKLGPDYKRPAIVHEPPAFRRETPVTTNSFADLPWWHVFHDENLQALIRTALTNNYDIRIAFTRIEQERQLVAETRAGLFPQVNYGGNLGTGVNTIPGTSSIISTGRTNVTLLTATLNGSWEIDLWGRIRRLTESQRAQYFASVEARRNVTITLISQLAQDYFLLLALDRELAIARDETNAYAGSLKIFAQRLEQGAASRLETSSAEALLESAAATIPDLERQVAQLENQISILLGENPHAIMRERSRLEDQLPPEVPAGLPSSLLERRPDIREAEQLLRSANAQVGVAKADFFPQLALTGAFGQASSVLTAASGGSAIAWSVAAGLTGPLFQGGRLRAQYRQALAIRNQYALQYQYTVLTALQEVSNALIARQKLAQARIAHARAVTANQEAVRIVIQRYRLGQSSYFEVLQEQQLLYPEENALVQTQFNQLAAIVQLYIALGGGWQVEEKKR